MTGRIATICADLAASQAQEQRLALLALRRSRYVNPAELLDSLALHRAHAWPLSARLACTTPANDRAFALEAC